MSADSDTEKKTSVRTYLVWAAVILAICVAAELLGEFVAPAIGMALFGLLALVLMVYPIRDFYKHQRYDAKLEFERRYTIYRDPRQPEPIYTPSPIVVTLAALVGFVVFSGEFLRFWSLVYGGFSGQGRTISDLGGGFFDVLNWLLFVCSWAVDDILANPLQITGTHISTIQVISGDAQFWVWCYNPVLAFLILSTLWRAFRDFVAF